VYPILKEIISVKTPSNKGVASCGKFTVKEVSLSHWVNTQQDWKGKDIHYKDWIRNSLIEIWLLHFFKCGY